MRRIVIVMLSGVIAIAAACATRPPGNQPGTLSGSGFGVPTEQRHLSLLCGDFPAHLAIGDTATVTAAIASLTYDVEICGTPESGVTWSSSDKTVLRIDSTGRLEPRAGGRVTVTARLGGQVATRYVDVTPPAGSFAWEPRSATVPVGDTVYLRAVVRDSAGHPVRRFGPSFVPGGSEYGSADVLIWSDSDTVAVVIGRAPGHIVLGAKLGQRIDTAVVTVVPRVR
jgi:plastocyanin